MEKIPAIACMGFRATKAGGSERERMLGLLRDAFLPWFDHYVIASDLGQGDDPFNRAVAKNNAADHARRIDDDPEAVLVFCDSDTYAPYHQVAFAVEAVRAHAADLCLAHNGIGVYMASGAGRGNGTGGIHGPFPGGIFAIRRSVFDSMGGWDNRFVGWGHEDLCFLYAAERLFGFKIALSNHPAIGPFFKMDLLYPRADYEGELMEGRGPEVALYEANTRRRDAYFALKEGDVEGYWALREKEIE